MIVELLQLKNDSTCKEKIIYYLKIIISMILNFT